MNAPAIHPTRRVHGWQTEEIVTHDGQRSLVLSKGARIMNLMAGPDVTRDVLWERGIEAAISDDAHHAVRHNDRRGVAQAEQALRRHRMHVASKRLERIRQRVLRDRELIVIGRIKR